MQIVTAGQLPDSPPNWVILRCSACSAEYSANRGDYFLADPNEALVCECGFGLMIVTRKTVYNHSRGQDWLVAAA
jgi:hypothetical protein